MMGTFRSIYDLVRIYKKYTRQIQEKLGTREYSLKL